MAAHRSERAVLLVAIVVAGFTGTACGGGEATDPGVDSHGDQSSTWYQTVHDLDEALFDAHLTSDGDWIVVGGTATRGLVLVLRDGPGSVWREDLLPDGTARLRAVWGSPEAGTFVVGDGATILRRAGLFWDRQSIDAPPNTVFNGVWGSGPDDVWVVGGTASGASAGVIVHWDGLAWSRSADTAAGNATFHGVWGSDAAHVFAVGDQGTVVAWDGTAWTREATDADVRLAAVWGRSGDDVFAGGGEPGGEGLLLRRDAATWSTVFTGPSALHAVVGFEFDDGRFFVGGELGYVGEFGGSSDDYGFRRGDSRADVDFLGGTADSSSMRRVLVGADVVESASGGGYVATNFWWPSSTVVRLGDSVP